MFVGFSFNLYPTLRALTSPTSSKQGSQFKGFTPWVDKFDPNATVMLGYTKH